MLDRVQTNRILLPTNYSPINNITETRVPILDQAFRISYNVNTLGKGMHPTILPPAIAK